MLGPVLYDMTPPAPLPYPKMYHYSLDPGRHSQHRFSNAFLANTKPMLIPCHAGVPPEELILFAAEHNAPVEQLHPDDAALINESLMEVGRQQ